jgi:hypothetical protein
VLERLDKSYNDFKTSIYSEFRTNQKAYTLESLSTAILDKFRRRKQQKKEDSSDEEEKVGQVLYTNTKKGYSSKPWKKVKGKYCNYYKKPGHLPHKCFHLHPSLKRPQSTTSTNNRVEKKKKGKPNKARQEREDNENTLLIAKVRSLGDIPSRPRLQEPLQPDKPRLIELASDNDSKVKYKLNNKAEDKATSDNNENLIEGIEKVFITTTLSQGVKLANSLSGLVTRL